MDKKTTVDLLNAHRFTWWAALGVQFLSFLVIVFGGMAVGWGGAFCLGLPLIVVVATMEDLKKSCEEEICLLKRDLELHETYHYTVTEPVTPWTREPDGDDAE